MLEVGSNKDVAKYFQCSNIKEHKVVQSLLDTLATKAMIEAAYICFWGLHQEKSTPFPTKPKSATYARTISHSNDVPLKVTLDFSSFLPFSILTITVIDKASPTVTPEYP